MLLDTHTTVNDGVAEVDGTWSGYLGAHGGYLAAIALRAATQAVDDEQRLPRSLGIHLLAPVRPGEVALEPRVERTGRSSSMASVRLRQEERTVAFATAAFGTAGSGPTWEMLDFPDVPAPEDCAPLGFAPVPEAGMAQYVEYRPAREPLPLSGSDRAEILVWMRLGEGRPVDELAATFLADAAVPALYATLTEYAAMPTTDLTLHYAARPEDPGEWVLGVFRTRRAADGYAVEDGELWTRDGAPLVLARQLRRVLAR